MSYSLFRFAFVDLDDATLDVDLPAFADLLAVRDRLRLDRAVRALFTHRARLPRTSI